jgi:hypothetical protein
MMRQVAADDDFYVDAVSPDLRHVVVKNTGAPLFKNQKFYFWDMSKQTMLGKFLCENENSAVRCVEVRSDNSAVLIDGRRIVIYDCDKQTILRTVIANKRITACAVDSDYQYGIIAEFVEHWVSGKRVTSVVDVREGEIRGKVEWSSSGVALCKFLNSHDKAIACDLSGAIAVIDCRTMKAELLVQKCNTIPSSMTTRNGSALIAGVHQGQVRAALIPVPKVDRSRHLSGHVKPVFAAAFVGDKTVITADDGGVCCVWSVEDGIVNPKTLIKRAPDGMVFSGLLAGDEESGNVYVCENFMKTRGRDRVTTPVLTKLNIKSGSYAGSYVFGDTLVSRGTAGVCEFTTDGISGFKSEPMK